VASLEMASCFIAQSAPLSPDVVSTVSPGREAGAELGNAVGTEVALLDAGVVTAAAACGVAAFFLQPTAVMSTGSTSTANVLRIRFNGLTPGARENCKRFRCAF